MTQSNSLTVLFWSRCLICDTGPQWKEARALQVWYIQCTIHRKANFWLVRHTKLLHRWAPLSMRNISTEQPVPSFHLTSPFSFNLHFTSFQVLRNDGAGAACGSCSLSCGTTGHQIALRFRDSKEVPIWMLLEESGLLWTQRVRFVTFVADHSKSFRDDSRLMELTNCPSNSGPPNTELTCYLIESAMREMHFDNFGLHGSGHRRKRIRRELEN
jgi:hypothetical protein